MITNKNVTATLNHWHSGPYIMTQNYFRFRKVMWTSQQPISRIHFQSISLLPRNNNKKKSSQKVAPRTSRQADGWLISDGNRPQQVEFRSKIDHQVNKREDAPTGDHEQSHVAIETSGCRVRDSHSARGCHIGGGSAGFGGSYCSGIGDVFCSK